MESNKPPQTPPPGYGSKPAPPSKRQLWEEYRARHRAGVVAGSLERIGDMWDFWADAAKEHSSAVVGWGQEIIQDREYPLKRVVPDILTFSSGAMSTATKWVKLITKG